MLSVLVFVFIYTPHCSFGEGKLRFSPVIQRYTYADATNQESLKDDKKITITGDGAAKISSVTPKCVDKIPGDDEGGTGAVEGDKDYDTDTNPSSSGDNAGQTDTNRPLEVTVPVS